jgi:hypothetical protein
MPDLGSWFFSIPDPGVKKAPQILDPDPQHCDITEPPNPTVHLKNKAFIIQAHDFYESGSFTFVNFLISGEK